MKKVVGILSLLVLLITEIVTPITYASEFGEESGMDANVFVESGGGDGVGEEAISDGDASNLEVNEIDSNGNSAQDEDNNDDSIEGQTTNELGIVVEEEGDSACEVLKDGTCSEVLEEEGNLIEDEQSGDIQEVGDEQVEEKEVEEGNDDGLETEDSVENGEILQAEASEVLEEVNLNIIDNFLETVSQIVHYFFKKENNEYIKYASYGGTGIISLVDPENGSVITMLDANLGAESDDYENEVSYGNYYQWGSAYGFKDLAEDDLTTRGALYSEKYAGKGYSRDTKFRIGNNDIWEVDEETSKSSYDELWYDGEHGEVQGVCPDGYHVPSLSEWKKVVSTWIKIHTQDTVVEEENENMEIRSSINSSFKNSLTSCEKGDMDENCIEEENFSEVMKLFQKELNLPLAGSYSQDGAYVEGAGVYWTTTPGDLSYQSQVFDIHSYFGGDGIGVAMNRAEGHSVRCFMDTFEKGNSDSLEDDVIYNLEEIVGEEEYNGVTVKVVAPVGSFPEGTELRITTIDNNDSIQAKEDQLVEKVKGVEENTLKVSFDIAFYDPENPDVEISPVEGKVVSVVFDYQGNDEFKDASEAEDLKLVVYHLEEDEEDDSLVTPEEVELVETDENESVVVEIEKKGEDVEVEVDEFSVYTLTVVEDTSVTVTLDGNGGDIIWGDDVSNVECEDGVCTGTIASVDGYVTLPDATKDNAVFLGWIGGNLTGITQGAVIANENLVGNVYKAKFTCTSGYIETGDNSCLEITDSDTGISYDTEAQTITIWGGGMKYTIQDRNVGATMTGGRDNPSDDGSQGYLFQWGNNNGVYNNVKPSSQSAGVDVEPISFPSTYSGLLVNTTNSNAYVYVKSDISETVSGYYNLWGGLSSDEDWIARRGPCSAGYHVPSTEEMDDLLSIGKIVLGYNSVNSLDFITDFVNALYIPQTHGYYYWGNNAGWKEHVLWTNQLKDDRHGNTLSLYDFGNNTWISTVGGKDDRILLWRLNPVRCFQNYIACSPNQHTEGYSCIDNEKESTCIAGEIENGRYIETTMTATWTSTGWSVPLCTEYVCNDGYKKINGGCMPGNYLIVDYNTGASAITGFVQSGEVTMEPDIVERDGYQLVGWYTDTSFENEFIFGNELTEDTTIYAKWNSKVSFIVDENVVLSGYYASGYSLENPNLDPVKDGYDFVGWYYTGLSQVVEFPLIVTGVLNFYAKWENPLEENLTGWDGCYKYKTYTGENNGDVEYYAEITDYSGSCQKENLSITGFVVRNDRTYMVKSIGTGAFVGKGLTGTLSFSDGIEWVGAASFQNNSITAVTLNEGLVSLGDAAFYNDNISEQIVFPSTLKVIGDLAFGYNALEEITLPSNVTALGNASFYENNLKDIKIYSYDISLGGSVFGSQKQSIQSIQISGGIINSNTFSPLTGLEELRLGTGVTSIGSHAFNYTQIEELIIPNSVTSINSYAFQNNTKLKTVKFGTGLSVLNDNVFGGSTGIEYVDLGSVQTIGDGNFSNTQIEELVIPDSVTSISSSAFQNNTKLKTVKIGTGLRILSGPIFYGCTQLETVYLGDGVEIINSTFPYDTNLKNIFWGNNVKSIYGQAFYNVGIEKLVLPDSVTTISAGAFQENVNLKKVTLGAGLTGLNDGVFLGSTGIEYVDLGNVQIIGADNFSGTQLTGLVIPESVISIATGAFINNTNLQTLTLGSNLTSIGSGAFANSALTGVSLPSSLTTLGNSAFCYDNEKNVGSVIGTTSVTENISSLEEQDGTDCFVIKRDAYTVTYDAESHSGTIDSSTGLVESLAYGTVIPLTGEGAKLATSEKGYTFLGWTTELGGTEVIDFYTLTDDITLYPVFKKEEINLTAYFNANGASFVDGAESSTGCSIAAVFNTGEQATTCVVIAPEVAHGSSLTPNIVGYHLLSGATTNHENYNTGTRILTLNVSDGEDQQWYVISKSSAIATFLRLYKNGNTNIGVIEGLELSGENTDEGYVEYLLCSIAESYNNQAQASECSTGITIPSITANGTKTVLGWSVEASTGSNILYEVGASVNLTGEKDAPLTLFAQSVKAGESFSALFSGNGLLLEDGFGEVSVSCTGENAYNGEDEEKTSQCSVDAPETNASSLGRILMGFSESSNVVNSGASLPSSFEILDNNKVYYAISYTGLTARFDKNGNQGQKKYGSDDVIDGIIEEYCEIWNSEETCSVMTPQIVPAENKITIGYSDSSSIPGTLAENTSLSLSSSANYYAWSQSQPSELTLSYIYGIGVNVGDKSSQSCTPDVKYNAEEIDYDCSISLPALVVSAGYNTPKWYRGEEAYDANTEFSLSENTTLTAQATANTDTQYVVKHYFQMLENNAITNKYKLEYTDNGLSGTTDETLVLSLLQRENLTGFSYWKARVGNSDETEIDLTNIDDYKEEAAIDADGNLVVKLYYTRNKNSFSITANEKVTTQGSSSNGVYYYGQLITISGNVNDDCYMRSGWIGLPDEVGNIAQISFSMPDNDVTIGSEIKEKTYTIRFEANADDAEGSMENLSVKCSENKNVPAVGFTRVGYSFSGWSLTADGAKAYDNEVMLPARLTTEDGAEIPFYAVWDANIFSIIFDDQGATTGGTSKIWYRYQGETYYLDEELETPLESFQIPSKNGYVFSGYYTDSNGSGEVLIDKEGNISAGVSGLIDDEGITGYAYWVNNPHLLSISDVVHVTRGGNEPRAYNYGDAITVSFTPDAGYSITGLMVSPELGGSVSVDESGVLTYSFNMPDSAVSVTPLVDANVYTVHFYANGGDAGEMGEQSFRYDAWQNLSENAYTRVGYDFGGWNTEADGSGTGYTDGQNVQNLSAISGAVVSLYAQWNIKTYTVLWKNWDGSVLKTGLNVEYGSSPTYDGVAPVRGSTAEYDYSFAGWDPGEGAITSDTVYTASYTPVKRSYKISFVDEDETILWSGDFEYGELPTYGGETPIKDSDAQYSYSFSGWSPGLEEVSGEKTYMATYRSTLNTYTVVWKDWNGSVLETDEQVEYGTTPSFDRDEPVSGSTAEYSYSFNGWSPSISEVQGDQEYVAQYSSTKRKYVISFLNDDNSVLQSTEVEYGEIPVYSGTPEKVGDAQYSYSFVGWDSEIIPVVGAASYKATYTGTINTYSVVWKNDNGVILETDAAVEYGATPEYNGVTPQKESSAEYDYSFSGWSPEISAVVGDAVYTAYYSGTKRSYLIRFLNDDGTILQASNVEYGALPSYGDTPVKTGDAQYNYSFSGWDSEIVTVSENKDYTAVYDVHLNSYLIRFYDDNDVLLTGNEYPYGTLASAIVKPEAKKTGWSFMNWDPEVVDVVTGADYRAVFSINSYDISAEVGTGVESVSGGGYYEYGTTVVLNAVAKTGYAFEGGVREKIFEVQVPAYDSKVVIQATPNIYSVIFNANGGSGSMENQEFRYDKEQALSPNSFEKNGYVFSGWKDEDGSKHYADVETVVNLASEGEVVLIAEWNAVGEYYTVVFKDGDTVLSEQSLLSGESIVLPERPTKAGYEFVGWENLPEDGVVHGADLVIIAQWIEKENGPSEPRAGGGGGRRIIDEWIDLIFDEEHFSADEEEDKQEETSEEQEVLSAYDWAYKYGITTIAPEESAMPDGDVLRGHMAKMIVNFMVNVLGREVPDDGGKCDWIDKENDRESEEIKDYARKACAFGLMGINVSDFMPNERVTRAQFGTIFSRAIWGDTYDEEGDLPYYVKHLKALQEKKIMTDVDNPEARVEQRKWIWVMLKRYSDGEDEE